MCSVRKCELVAVLLALTPMLALGASTGDEVAGDEQCADVASLMSFGPSSTIVGASDLPSFASFISEYGRKYTVGTSDFEERRKVFESQVAEVRKHNSNPDRLWNAEVNHLSDRTEEELKQLRGLRVMSLGKKRVAGAVDQHKNFLHQLKNDVLPAEKSWAHLKSLKEDTDQAACGSCWAVATATMLASNAEINGYNNTFSAQELVSCVPNPYHCGGKGGCTGSTVELAMNWVMEKGLATTHDTPYLGQDGFCKKGPNANSLLSHDGDYDVKLENMIAIGFHAAEPARDGGGIHLGLKGWERLPENQHDPLMDAIAFRGPVAISVAAHGWNSYASGIYDSCPKDAVVDHAVVLIGYGKDKVKGDPYWLIKNSWGLSWGENGNIRMLRTDGQYCGTDSQPEVGTGCDGGPSSVEVCGMCGILYDTVIPHFEPAQ